MAEKLPWIVPTAIAVGGAFLVTVVILKMIMPRGTDKKGRSHVIITGGSSGIGLALAAVCAKRGFENVTLVARNKTRLEEAKKQVEEECRKESGDGNVKATIRIVSVDVTEAGKVKTEMDKLIKEMGPPDVVFSNAGVATARSFDDLPVEEFERLVRINYLGGVYLSKAVLPHIKKNGGGTIVFTSSMAGLTGVFGYSAYSPAKFALRGFAEALQMEVRRDNISVVLAFPPDSDTPGFKLENEGKPKETELISEAGGLFDPKV